VLRKPSAVSNRLLDRINAMPVIDCHEHLGEPGSYLPEYCAQVHAEPIRFTDEKWPVFRRLWAATEHTAYARVTKLVLKEMTGSDDLTRESLDRVAEQLPHHDQAYHLKLLRDAGIKALVTDALYPRQQELRQFQNPELTVFLEGKYQFPEGWHPAFTLSAFFGVRRREFIDHVEVLADSEITSMAEYERAVFEIIRKSKGLGVVSLKVG